MKGMLLGRWRAAAVIAVSAALFVPLLLVGAPAFAHTGAAASEYEYSSASQYQYRLAICHRTHSKKHPWIQITVSSRAWPAHRRHGDTLPPCPAGTRIAGKENAHHASTEAGKSGQEHGKSGSEHGQSGSEHGKSGSHGGRG